MATVVDFTIEEPATGELFPEGVRIVKWASLADGDSGTPYRAPHYADKSVQVSGTPGAGGNCRIQGSNVANGVSVVYGTLNDPQGNVLDFTAADVTANKLEEVLENSYLIRPTITAGDTTTAISVRLLISTVSKR